MLGTDDVEVALMVARIAAVRAPDAPTEADAESLLLLAATVLSLAVYAPNVPSRLDRSTRSRRRGLRR